MANIGYRIGDLPEALSAAADDGLELSLSGSLGSRRISLANLLLSLLALFGVYALAAGETGVVTKKYPVGHVKRYGAVCDGTTDDTTAVLNATASVGGGSYKSKVLFPAAPILVTNSIKPPAAPGVTKALIFEGQGQATQIINGASVGKPTFDMSDVGYWTIRDVLCTGNSSHPNDAIWHKNSDDSTSRWKIENVVTMVAGKGIVLSRTNTGVIRDCKHWPSSNAAASWIAPVVTAADISHGIYMTGPFVNDVTIYDYDCQPQYTYATGMCSIKCDATNPIRIAVIGGSMEGNTASVVGANPNQPTSLDLANVSNFLIQSVYCENSWNKFTNCTYGTIIAVDKASDWGTTLAGCVWLTFLGCQDDTLNIDVTSKWITLQNCNYDGASNQIVDNGVQTRYINVTVQGGLIPDRGPTQIAARFHLSGATALPAGTATTIKPTVTDFNFFSNYDSSSGVFTPGVKGYYRLTLRGYTDTARAAGAGPAFSVDLYKNGGSIGSALLAGSGGNTGVFFSDLAEVSSATDTLSFSIYNYDSSSHNLNECAITLERV